MPDVILQPDETLDPFWRGAVRVIQKKKGYRFSLDAPLLAWFVEDSGVDSCLDLGTGCGILAILLLRSSKCRRAIGLEIQPALCDLSRRNAALNGCEDTFTVVQGDIKQAGATFRETPFSMVVTNPPYRPLSSGRRSPVKEKEIARHEVLVCLKDVIEQGASCLVEGGRFYLIHQHRRSKEILNLLEANQCPAQAIQHVRPHARANPAFVLIKARKGGAPGDVEKRPPITLHDAQAKYTEELERILRPKEP